MLCTIYMCTLCGSQVLGMVSFTCFKCVVDKDGMQYSLIPFQASLLILPWRVDILRVYQMQSSTHACLV